MTQRFICPHCLSPLDPYSMEQASSRDAQLRVCPNCDEPVVLQPVTARIEGAVPKLAPLAHPAPR